jgi:nitrogen regulatory protein P-II 1
MKKIEAIIRPSELEAAIAALSHAWIGGVTVDEVEGYGRQKGHIEIYRGAEYVIEMVPKLRVAVVVPDPLVPRVLYDLERAVRTGRIGDGKIFVLPVQEAVSVRSGERGEAAL